MRRGAMLLTVLLGLVLQGDRMLAEGAETFSSPVLLRWCGSGTEGVEFAACAYYFKGFMDAVQAEQASTVVHLPKPCIPLDATAEQIRLVVIKFMRDKPELLFMEPSTVSYAALQKGFPCS